MAKHARLHTVVPQGKVRKSLVYSFWDGAFSSVMTGLTAEYISPYALALKATNSQIALFGAIPPLISSLVQLKTADFVEHWRSRRKVINIFIFLHLLMIAPIVLIPFLFSGHAVVFLLGFVTLFTAFNAFAGPAWASLMAEYIPYRSRGAYFGWRNKVFGFVTVGGSLSAGYILHCYHRNVLAGFMLIFALAGASRLISWYFLTRMYEPRFHVAHGSYFSFWTFIRRIRHSNYARYVVLLAGFHFCVNIAAPFFSVLMLRDLKFSYLTYTVLVTIVPLVNMITIDRWGRHADKIGNLKVIQVTSVLIATLPLWWIFSQHPVYLVGVQALGGFAWAGFNLASMNFIYDAACTVKRTRCISYFNVCVGVGVCLGALLGGLLVNHLPNILISPIMTLIVISSLLRFVVVGFLRKMVKEVRDTHKVHSPQVLASMIGLRPIEGLARPRRWLPWRSQTMPY